MTTKSEPVNVEDVVKAGTNLVRLWGWIKRIFRGSSRFLVLFCALSLSGCGSFGSFIKWFGNLPIPPVPTSAPTATNTPLPTLTPTSIPTFPTLTPSPSSTSTPVPTVSEVKKPLVAFWKVGGLHQPIEQYRCQNPQDGPKFQNQNICNVGSTTYFTCSDEGCDQRKQGPCDPDHQNDFCYGRFDWDDYRGPDRIVDGAQDWEIDPENSYNTLVHFIPGKAFRICTQAKKDYHTPDGLYLLRLPNTQTCTEHRYK